jgi:SSS family solute:Na+ symporter
MPIDTGTAALQGGLATIDWVIVAAILGATTLLGLLCGRGATIREFFLGGRKLPWWAVSASIIATEISALTLVGVPFVVFKQGGNFTYLQLVLIGSVIARCVIAWKLVPAYYEHEIYSPYDYIGARLGRRARDMATALFALGGILSQAARVYVTAVVLEIVLHGPLEQLSHQLHIPTLALSIGVLTVFAILWTWIGGIRAVVWTDLFLFFVLAASAVIALSVVAQQLDIGFARIWRVGIDAHKLTFFDFDTSPAKTFTFWSATIAWSWSSIASYGVDQLMAQRLLCCRNVRDARLALVTSSVGTIVSILVAFVGVGLFAYYERHPLTPAALALYEARGERLLPIFITEVVPVGLKGLIVAGILAAAISSLDAILAALSQTALTSLYLPWRARRTQNPLEDKHAIRVSRFFVILAGLALAALAWKLNSVSRKSASILDLGLEMATYTQGALLAGFAIAYLRPRAGGSGFVWSAPLSVAVVFALARHEPRVPITCIAFATSFLAAWIFIRTLPALLRGERRLRALQQLVLVLLTCVAIVWLNRFGLIPVEQPAALGGGWLHQRIEYPWYVPIGSTVAFVLGLALCRDAPTETHLTNRS